MTTFAVLVGLSLFVLCMVAVRDMVGTVLCNLASLVGVPFNWYTDWAIAGVATITAPVVAFVVLACGVAAIEPPPQEFTYASMEKREDATFWERNVAYFMIGTGLADVEVKPGVVYSTAKLKTNHEEVTFVGLPGTGKWYRL